MKKPIPRIRPKPTDKKERAERRRNLARAIDLAWDSLRSHLADAVKSFDQGGNEEWQARCCREYAEIIYSLSVELHELAKIDFRRIVESAKHPI